MKKTLLIIVALTLCWALPAPAGTPAEMAKHLPDKVGDYQASSPAQPEQMPFPDFEAVVRSYQAPGGAVKVTIYRMGLSSNVSYKVGEDVEVNGLPGRVRIMKDKKLVGLLVSLRSKKPKGKRKIVVSVMQEGTTDSTMVLEFARKFDYRGLIEMQ